VSAPGVFPSAKPPCGPYSVKLPQTDAEAEFWLDQNSASDVSQTLERASEMVPSMPARLAYFCLRLWCDLSQTCLLQCLVFCLIWVDRQHANSCFRLCAQRTACTYFAICRIEFDMDDVFPVAVVGWDPVAAGFADVGHIT
jgi:hypothetical protein